jgi:hypothetical protein
MLDWQHAASLFYELDDCDWVEGTILWNHLLYGFALMMSY